MAYLVRPTDQDPEKFAEDFVKLLKSEKNTMSTADAEKRVKEILGYDKYDFSDKKVKK